jgi:hypothetical protein
VHRRTPHGAAWRAITGRVPAAGRQPFRPGTVFARVFHRVLWRFGTGSPAAPPPPITYGTAQQGQMAIPAALAGQSAAEHADAGTAALPAARADTGQAAIEHADAGQMTIPHAEGGQ